MKSTTQDVAGLDSSDLDYAFSDENLPDGWPELDWPEFLLGEWIPRKTPSSRAIRHQLAAVARFFREEVAGQSPADRKRSIQLLREMHRKHKADLIAVEASVADLRRRMLPAWKLWSAKAEGGLQ